MQIIDGKKISQIILDDLKNTIDTQGLHPGLAVIMVGEDPASLLYIKNKQRAAYKIGVHFHVYFLPEQTLEYEIIQTIQFLNQDEGIHGMIVQLPLPNRRDPTAVIQTIAPTKDADGFHPQNLKHLLTLGSTRLDEMRGKSEPRREAYWISTVSKRRAFNKTEPQPRRSFKDSWPKPVTAMSVITALMAITNPPPLKIAAIVCKSSGFYQPLAALLALRDIQATHHLQVSDELKIYDLVVIALGQAQVLKKNHIKKNTIVIDVGIHHLTNSIVGDADFEDLKDIVFAITPVPGGIGQITVAMLLKNTVELCKIQKAGVAKRRSVINV